MSLTDDWMLMVHSSYVEDPKWQRKFSIIWASFVGLAVLASAPRLWKSIKQGRAFKGFWGVTENFGSERYVATLSEAQIPGRRRNPFSDILRSVGSLRLWSLPGLELNLGQSTSLIIVRAVTRHLGYS